MFIFLLCFVLFSFGVCVCGRERERGWERERESGRERERVGEREKGGGREREKEREKEEHFLN